MGLLLPVTKLPACLYSLFKILPRTPIPKPIKKENIEALVPFSNNFAGIPSPAVDLGVTQLSKHETISPFLPIFRSFAALSAACFFFVLHFPSCQSNLMFRYPTNCMPL